MGLACTDTGGPFRRARDVWGNLVGCWWLSTFKGYGRFRIGEGERLSSILENLAVRCTKGWKDCFQPIEVGAHCSKSDDKGILVGV